MNFKTAFYFAKLMKLTEIERSELVQILDNVKETEKQVLKDICDIKTSEELDSLIRSPNNQKSLTSKLASSECIDDFGFVDDFDNFNLTERCVYTSIHSSMGDSPFHGIRYYETAHIAIRQEFQRLFVDEVTLNSHGVSDYNQNEVDSYKDIFANMSLLLSWEQITSPCDQEIVQAFKIILEGFRMSRGKIDLLCNHVSPYNEKTRYVPLPYSEENTSGDSPLWSFDWDSPDHIQWLRKRLVTSDWT